MGFTRVTDPDTLVSHTISTLNGEKPVFMPSRQQTELSKKMNENLIQMLSAADATALNTLRTSAGVHEISATTEKLALDLEAERKARKKEDFFNRVLAVIGVNAGVASMVIAICAYFR